MNQKRVPCQTSCPDLGFGKHGHLNNGALFEAEREERRDGGKVYTRVTPGGCAFNQEGANLLCTSGRAVTKGNGASAYTSVKTRFFPEPGVSTEADQNPTDTSPASPPETPRRDPPPPLTI